MHFTRILDGLIAFYIMRLAQHTVAGLVAKSKQIISGG